MSRDFVTIIAVRIRFSPLTSGELTKQANQYDDSIQFREFCMSDLVVITTYYNPCHDRYRRANYDVFIDGIRRSGVPCVTVECAFGNQPFQLPESIDVIRVRATSLFWQKERLLNLAASWLPPQCRYVSWLDCDIVFDNPQWHRDLRQVLQTYPIAQVFETCLRLNKEGVVSNPQDMSESFASVMKKSPNSLERNAYASHGHTGYGWACHKSIFDTLGLYECAISGGADHLMAHAIYGHMGLCVTNTLKGDVAQIAHLALWGNQFRQLVQGRLGVVPGQIRHLWHGDTGNERSFSSMQDISDLGFNPWTDLERKDNKPLSWAPDLNKPALVSYFSSFFASRQDDSSTLINGVPT